MAGLFSTLAPLVVVISLIYVTEAKFAPDVAEIQHPVTLDILIRMVGPNGAKSINTYKAAEALCETRRMKIAENWRLRDAIAKQHFRPCQGCGWMSKTAGGYPKNFRPYCGKIEEAAARLLYKNYYIQCPDVPPRGEGYDVYCYGDSAPDLPPDAVAINQGPAGPDDPVQSKDQGYVFIMRDGSDEVIETESLGKTLCRKRGAELATAKQVGLAYYNGFGMCACGWMQGFQGMVMNDKVSSCGDRVGFMGCPYGDIKNAFCFVHKDDKPYVHSGPVVNFNVLKPKAPPLGVEQGAILINDGYVFPSKHLRGNMKMTTAFMAHETCQAQGAIVASTKQVTQAMKKGMTWCECSWVWDNVKLVHDIMTEGKGAAIEVASDKRQVSCAGKFGVTTCPVPVPEGASGYNVFCFKKCPKNCPPDIAWNMPYQTIRITGGRVFHVEHRNGKYKIGNVADAEAECKINHGSKVASLEQLREAQENGMTKCRCGYVSSGDVYFPTYRPMMGCGNAYGLYQCPGSYQAIPEKGPNWDVYCFIDDARLTNDNRFIKHVAKGRL